MAPVLVPHRFCRTTRQWVMRTPQEKGGYQYAVLVTSVSDLAPPTVADAYDGRAMIEATVQTPPTDPLRIWSVKPTVFLEGIKFLSRSKTMLLTL